MFKEDTFQKARLAYHGVTRYRRNFFEIWNGDIYKDGQKLISDYREFNNYLEKGRCAREMLHMFNERTLFFELFEETRLGNPISVAQLTNTKEKTFLLKYQNHRQQLSPS